MTNHRIAEKNEPGVPAYLCEHGAMPICRAMTDVAVVTFLVAVPAPQRVGLFAKMDDGDGHGAVFSTAGARELAANIIAACNEADMMAAPPPENVTKN